MTSPSALLFLAIQQRLQSVTISTPNGDQPVFNFIDQDLGQLEDATKGINRPPVSWPAALIDIEDSNYQNIGSNAQVAVVNICVRIAFPPFSATGMAVPAPYRDKALYYYDIEQAAILALHGWNPATVTVDDTTMPPITADLSGIFGHLIRVRATTEGRNDLLRVRVLTFTLSMDDYSTQEGIELVPATISLSTIFNIPS